MQAQGPSPLSFFFLKLSYANFKSCYGFKDETLKKLLRVFYFKRDKQRKTAKRVFLPITFTFAFRKSVISAISKSHIGNSLFPTELTSLVFLSATVDVQKEKKAVILCSSFGTFRLHPPLLVRLPVTTHSRRHTPLLPPL